MKAVTKITFMNDDGEKFFGEGPATLLREIDKTGSLRAAAISMGMAYTKALKLMKKEFIHLLGSDCHNLKRRPPCLGSAMETLLKKFGGEFVEGMKHFCQALLKSSLPVPQSAKINT